MKTGVSCADFYDVASLNISAADPASILRSAQELHPPLFYLLLHGWQGLAAGEAWLRLPSALAGIAALPLIWRAAAALWGETAGVLALALLALSPLHIWYAREARMYALACLFGLAALSCYLRLLRGGSLRHSVGYAAAILLAVFTSYSALALWIGLLALFPFLAKRLGATAQARGFWLVQPIVVAGFAAYLPVFGAQVATGNLGFLGERLATVSPALWLACIAGTSAALLAVWHLRPLGQRLPAWAPWIIFLACLLFTLLAAVPRGFSVKRQLLVFWPAATLAAAWALSRLRRRAWIIAGLAVPLAATLVLLASGPLEDWRAAAADLSASAQSGDAIYTQSDVAGAALAHYYRGSARIWAPDRRGVWPQPLPWPDAGATAWLVANDHPSLRAEAVALAVRLATWGPQENRAAYDRYLHVTAYRPEAPGVGRQQPEGNITP